MKRSSLVAIVVVAAIDGDTLTVTVSGDSVSVDGAVLAPPPGDALAGEHGQEVAVFGIDRLLVAGA